MSAPEFSRPFDRRGITAEPVVLTASDAECAALSTRFALRSIAGLTAVLDVQATGAEVSAQGRLQANVVQICAISGDDLPVRIDEDIVLKFVPPRAYLPDQEIDLEAGELDEIEYEGTSFDLGEAVAQSLVLAIDPYAEGPEAARVRADVLGQEPEGPLAAALRGLAKK